VKCSSGFPLGLTEYSFFVFGCVKLTVEGADPSPICCGLVFGSDLSILVVDECGPLIFSVVLTVCDTSLLKSVVVWAFRLRPFLLCCGLKVGVAALSFLVYD
jgi:hypothetical protein